jgi:hypothetical protein
VEIRVVRECGVTAVTHHLWHKLGLDEFLSGIGKGRSARLAKAMFRMVVNRLSAPTSKLGLVDWSDECGHLHRGRQG